MKSDALCPWWAGYALNWGARRILHSPERILGPYLKPGMTALDIGCGMGYFSVPMAKMVGERGRVIAVDLQQKMLDGVIRNAENAGVGERITPHLCQMNTLRLEDDAGAVDFALAFMMVHEVPDPDRLIREIHSALRTGGLLLFAEPIVHVGREAYGKSLRMLAAQGFRIKESPSIPICRAAILEKQ